MCEIYFLQAFLWTREVYAKVGTEPHNTKVQDAVGTGRVPGPGDGGGRNAPVDGSEKGN